MVNFKNWLRLDELTSMSQIDSSSVKLKKVPLTVFGAKPYVYSFGEYEVELIPYKPWKVGGKAIGGIWSVQFARSGYWGLTGDSGGEAFSVYERVLAAIKKLMEIEQVNGLHFAAFEERQEIMYDKFLRTLGGFTPVGEGVYLRNEVVKAHASGKDLKLIRKTGAQRDSRLHNLRVAKAASRNKGLLGKITGYSQYGRVYPAIIAEIDPSVHVSAIIWDGSMPRDELVESYHFGNFVSPSLIDPALLSSLMGEVRNKRSYVSGLLKSMYPGVRVDGSTHDFGFREDT